MKDYAHALETRSKQVLAVVLVTDAFFEEKRGFSRSPLFRHKSAAAAGCMCVCVCARVRACVVSGGSGEQGVSSAPSPSKT